MIQIKVDADRLKQALKDAPRIMFQSTKKSLQFIGNDFKEKFTGSMRGRIWRSGALAGSLTSRVEGKTFDSLQLVASIGGANALYARLQEYGTDILPEKAIVPKNSKYLAIPLEAAKTASGIARYKSPRDIAGLEIIGKSKKGNWIQGIKPGITLIRKGIGEWQKKRISLAKAERAKGYENIPMFVLVKSVKLKPKLGMRDFWAKRYNNYFNLLKRNINNVINTILTKG